MIFPAPPTGTPLRIAVLAHLHHPIASPFAGGMESHTSHLVRGLVASGHQVTLFAKEGSDGPCTVVPLLERSYTVEGYPDSDGVNRQHLVLDGAMARAVARIRNGSFDAVLNNSLSPIPHSDLAAVPTLHVLHTPVLPRLAALFGAPGWLPDPMHRHVTVSHSNATNWRRWLPGIGVVHNGIELRNWDGHQHQVHGTAAWTGRITPEKGTHVAIAAARAARMKLRIAGPIQDREYFNSHIGPELDDDISYLGHLEQEELGAMIASAQVFISSPMWEEPFGLTTLEAIACGTPVAALPAGAMNEIVGARAGVMATAGDADALARAIVAARSLDRVKVRESAGAFSLDTMISTYEKLLRSVMTAEPVFI